MKQCYNIAGGHWCVGGGAWYRGKYRAIGNNTKLQPNTKTHTFCTGVHTTSMRRSRSSSSSTAEAALANCEGWARPPWRNTCSVLPKNTNSNAICALTLSSMFRPKRYRQNNRTATGIIWCFQDKQMLPVICSHMFFVQNKDFQLSL